MVGLLVKMNKKLNPTNLIPKLLCRLCGHDIDTTKVERIFQNKINQGTFGNPCRRCKQVFVPDRGCCITSFEM